jgi:hypothetical protein
MSYWGLERGKQKVLQHVRIVFDGAGNAQVAYDGGALGASTPCDPSTWLELFTSVTMDENVNFINTADDIGEWMDIGLGGTDGAGNAPASRLMISELGGIGYQPIRIDGGTRIVLKPTVTNPAAGTTMVINFFK